MGSAILEKGKGKPIVFLALSSFQPKADCCPRAMYLGNEGMDIIKCRNAEQNKIKDYLYCPDLFPYSS